MTTVCPCGSGRLLPLSPAQIREITANRVRSEVDLAGSYDCTVSTIRHLRALPRDLIQQLPTT